MARFRRFIHFTISLGLYFSNLDFVYSTISAQNPLDIPIRPKPCTIPREVRASAKISSRNFTEIRAKFYSSIDRFHVRRGDTVKKGQLIATTDTGNLKQMQGIYHDYVSLYKGELNISIKNLEMVTNRRERMRTLVAKSIIPQSDFDTVEKEVLAAETRREHVQRSVESMQKNYENYTEQIQSSNFYSDINGVVTEMIVDPQSITGNLSVMPGTLLAKVEVPGVYRAAVQMLDTQIHEIRVGMKADVTLPDGTTQIGKVTFVSVLPTASKKQDSEGLAVHSPNSQDGMTFYEANVEFDRPGAMMPSGLLAQVKIVTAEIKAEVCLPWNAIELDRRLAFVRTFKEGSGWQRSVVRLGEQGRYDVQILSPLGESSVVMSRLW